MECKSTENKWVVILCGGRGSRMGAITEDLPKSLVEVQGKPILWYTLLTLYEQGFRNYILPLGYNGDMIKSYINRGFRNMDCDIQCIDTGESTSIAKRMLQISGMIPEKSDFFLINSDTFFKFDIGAMYDLHKRQNALLTLSSVEIVSAWGLILMHQGSLVGFDRERKVRHLVFEKDRTIEGHVYSGFAWINKAALRYADMETCGDFESSLYPKIINIGRAAHFEIEGVWFPIDTPKDLQLINMLIHDKHGIGHVVRDTKESLSSNNMRRRTLIQKNLDSKGSL